MRFPLLSGLMNAVFCLLIGLALTPAAVYAADPTGSSDPTFSIVGRSGTRFTQAGATYHSPEANNYYMWFKPESMIDEVLNDAKAMGLNTIRLFAFCDGDDKDGYCFQGKGTRWNPAAQGAGVYDEPTFRKLDYIIARAGELGIRLILPLANQWDDNFGGMRQYVNWLWTADASQIPQDLQQSWLRDINVNALSSDAEKVLYQRYHDIFYTNPTTKAWYRAYVQYVLNRVNTYTGVRYKDDPAILLWELANEPRAESDPSGQTLQAWITEMAAFIKEQDPKHLLSTGEEGWYCDPSRGADEWRYNCKLGVDYLRNHRIADIDACSFHLYPDGYGLTEAQAKDWIREHVEDCRHLVGKPAYFGEYGWHAYRPNLLYSFATTTEGWVRDWDVGYAGNPVWVASPSYSGRGAMKFTTNSTFMPVTGDGGGARQGPFTIDFSKVDWISGYVYIPNAAPADLWADFYAQTGSNWSWSDGDDVPLTRGKWTQVSLRTQDMANRHDVHKIGMRVKTAGSAYAGPVYYDYVFAIRALDGWSPSPEAQLKKRDQVYADWRQIILDTLVDGAGFWYLSGIQPDGTPHLDGEGNEVLYPEDAGTVKVIKSLSAGMANRSRRPIVTPWEDCETLEGMSARTEWSDATAVGLETSIPIQGHAACKLSYVPSGYGKAYWEFGPVNQNWSSEKTLSLDLYSPTAGLRSSVVVATGAGWGTWYESNEVALNAGWNHIALKLKTATWKSEATGWQNTGAIQNLQQVNRVLIGLFGYQASGDVQVDNVRLGSSLQEGLLVYYPMEPPISQIVKDQSGYHNDAQIIGSPAWITEGVKGGAVSIAPGSYLQAFKNPTAGLRALTVSLWFKTLNPGNNYKLASAAWWQFGGDGSGWILGTHYPELWSDQVGNSIRTGGSWERITDFVPAGRPLEVGAWSQYGYGFEGELDEFRVYKRALRFEEIHELFAEGQTP
ncbi:MAG: cellulase family glycosylhydrolase [Candidatus Omnitrophica bacterium]|nr:cellulase family glycosylhydrolase [Candidatus Omnitrophota bacterium]